ncbi:RGG repeats nuclear RNA binding protein B-like [Daphnia pulicaria]|uniref:RGG repeats nuclear RNA binding protein B-like n=1 Tax=Daphnia pulicaria TaxID=35523 RepID=UPI001EEC55AD|nr:RGG repeats nuclear RNA binding protein B-like [Daphnia pulicaria]
MNKFDKFKDVVTSRGRGRGRGGGDRGGSRGGSRGRGDRGGSRGGSRGRGNFNGGDRRDRSEGGGDSQVGSGEGNRGKRTFQGGRGRGPPRGGRGRGGPSQGSRGRGGSSRGNRGRGGGRPVQAHQTKTKPIEKKEEVQENKGSEIKDGLSLYITFKDGPDIYELEKLKGFHSLNPPPNKKEKERIMLFRDLESLETAKLFLDAHKNVKSTNLMGLKSFKRQGSNSSDNCRLFLRFDKAHDEDAVKQLDSKILEVLPLKDSSCCKVEFASPEEAKSAAERLKNLIRKTGLRQVDVFAGNTATSSSTKPGISPTTNILQDTVVLRDVPKDATIKDISDQFPEAVSYYLYDKTFPASKYCHAAIRLNTERVAEILKCKNLKIAGKKVYVFPAHAEFLHDNPKLGEPEPEPVEESAKGTKVEPPSKKRKVDVGQEEESSEEEEEDEDDDDEEEAGDDGDDEEEDENDEGADEELDESD